MQKWYIGLISSLYLSFFPSVYNTYIIWYGVNQVMTHVCVLTNARCKEVDKSVSSKGCVSLVELNKRII